MRFVVFLLVCAAARGQTLSLDKTVRDALERNPEILAAQKRYEAARQRVRPEGALPDPMVGVGWNSSGGPLPFQGVGREPVANVGLMVTQQLPYPGTRGIKQRMASAEADAEWQQYQNTQLNVMSRVKQAFFRLHHTWRMLEVVEKNRQILRNLLGIAEIRYGVGKAMQQDVLKAQMQTSLLETRALQFVRDRRAREAEINSLLNRPLDTPLGKPEEIPVQPLLSTAEELNAAATESSPMLLREEKMIQRNEAAVSMARREYWPELAVTGGYYYMGMMPDMYMFRLDVSIPLWWQRKQRPAVTAGTMDLEQSRRAYEAANRGLQYRIKDDWLMVETAQKLMDTYTKAVIPQANLTFESSLASYQSGAGDFSMVLMNYMTAVEYEMNYHEEELNYHLAVARLEEMTGKPLMQAGRGVNP